MKTRFAGLKLAEEASDVPDQTNNIDFQGIPVTIEWPEGSTREGVDAEGNPWKTEMGASYGFIPDTVGAGDKEPMDVYVGEDDEADTAFIIEQLTETGDLDEYKVMLGFEDAEQALATYLEHYPQDWVLDRVGDIWSTDIATLRTAAEGVTDAPLIGEHVDDEVVEDAQNKVAAEGDQKPKKQRNKYGPKPEGYKSLLTTENTKTSKGEKLNYLTGILYLAPATEAGGIDLCPGRSPECTDGCLNTAGRGQFKEIQEARVKKTKFMFDNPGEHGAFMESLRYDIRKLKIQAESDGMKPAVRINGTSDIPKLALKMAREFPHVTFYDYSKLDKAWQRKTESDNYHLTFSRAEHNEHLAKRALDNGINCAVVFNTKKGQPLPAEYWGYEVIDGDDHDLRFLDESKDGRPVIVGLRAKGKAKKQVSNGFVVDVQQLGKAVPSLSAPDNPNFVDSRNLGKPQGKPTPGGSGAEQAA